MATFISLLNFTDQGIRNIKDSPDRYGAFRAVAEKLGVTVKGFQHHGFMYGRKFGCRRAHLGIDVPRHVADAEGGG